MRRPPSDHFNGKTFFQPGGTPEHGLRDLIRWRRTSRPVPWPKTVPVETVLPPPAPTGEGVSATWVGHSTFLIRTSRASWLTDPVFSMRIGPVPGVGPSRAAAPAVRLADLPPIDAILISHDHYDHCDRPTLRALARPPSGGPMPEVVSPLNYAALLRPFLAADRAVELDWWESHRGPGETLVQLVPARHWCRRRIGGFNERLWGGYFLRAGGRSVYFAGDTGFDAALFADIRKRCGPPDLALLPIGAYEPRWFMREAHMNPAEAVEAHRILGARQSVGMHWGTFQLTDEAREAPPQDLAAALIQAQIAPEAFRVLPLGGTLTI